MLQGINDPEFPLLFRDRLHFSFCFLFPLKRTSLQPSLSKEWPIFVFKVTAGTEAEISHRPYCYFSAIPDLRTGSSSTEVNAKHLIHPSIRVTAGLPRYPYSHKVTGCSPSRYLSACSLGKGLRLLTQSLGSKNEEKKIYQRVCEDPKFQFLRPISQRHHVGPCSGQQKALR